MTPATAIDLDHLVSTSQISAWDIVLAVVAILAGWLVGRGVAKATNRVLVNVSGISENLRQFTARVAKYLVLMLGVGVALSFLGAEIQPLITMAIIIGIIAVLALRGVADNFASGVVLQTRRPIAIGDEIEALGYNGVVTEMNGRSVVVETYDGQVVHLPNSKVLDNPIVNNFEHRARRVDVEIRAERGDEIEPTLDLIRRAVRSATTVLATPEPTVALTSAEPERLTILVRAWGPPGKELATASHVVEAVAEALAAAGIDATATTPPPPPPLTPPSPL